MQNFKRYLTVTALAGVLVLMACDGVGPTGPFGNLDSANLTGSMAKGGKKAQTDGTTRESATSDAVALVSEIQILDRTEPLAADVSVSRVIGKDGGVVTSWSGGFALFVPAGALKKDTDITVTALAGSKVAFDFQPHGLKFHEPVRIGIMAHTTTVGDDAFGVYYDGDVKNNPKILEFFTLFSMDGFTLLETTHFSGYALASGSRGSSALSGSSF